jgi:hypothetical protein
MLLLVKSLQAQVVTDIITQLSLNYLPTTHTKYIPICQPKMSKYKYVDASAMIDMPP